MMKRITSGYCWSRGRHFADSKNADEPCAAWVNETILKLIHMNLRTTVFYQALNPVRDRLSTTGKMLPAARKPRLGSVTEGPRAESAGPFQFFAANFTLIRRLAHSISQ
jgi:hypothetical protein